MTSALRDSSRGAPAPWRLWLDATVLGPLQQSPGRALVAVVAIALGVALGLAVHLINRVAADEVQRATRSLFGIADLAVQGSGGGFSEELYPRLARLPGVAVASPVIEVRGRLPGRAQTLQLLGVDAFRMRELQAPLSSLGATVANATGLLASDAVWLSPAAADVLGLDVDDRLRVQVGLATHDFTVAGLLPAGAYRQPLGMLDIAEAQRRFERLGRLDRIDLRLDEGSDRPAAIRAIAALLPRGAQLVTPGAASDDALRLTRAYRTNLTALALVALFTGGFLVYSTQMLAVARRRREIAFLHAMGVTVREQVAASLLAGTIVGIAGAALGVVLGLALAGAGLAAFGADLGAGYFRGPAPPLDAGVLECVLFFGLGLSAALAGSFAPAYEAASVPPAAALRSARDRAKNYAEPFSSSAGPEKRGAGRRGTGRIGVAGRFGFEPLLLGVLLMGAAGIVVWLPPGGPVPWPGYLSIACLLIGAVLAAPALARAVLDRLPDGGPAWRQIATAQLRGTARTTAVSLASVLVSFGLMVAMAIMVTSFRDSLDAWLQRILPADLYLRAGAAGSTGYFDVATQRRLARLPEIERIDFSTATEVRLRDGGPRLAVLARSIDESNAARLLPLRRVSDRPASAGTVPVWASEAALDLHGLDVDTEFELPLGDRVVRASVRGLWRDYDRSGGAIVLSRATYREHTGDARATSASLWLASDVSADAAAAAVRAELPPGDVYEIARPRELRQRSLAVFDRTFIVTYVIEAIAVLIGLVGVGAGISAQVLARRGEFGMLRHLGVLRRQIAGLLAFEGAVQGALGVTGGLAIGGVVSLVLIYVVNRQSFHWTMDLHIPWITLGVLSVVLIASAAATAAGSGRLAMSADVLRAVREDW